MSRPILTDADRIDALENKCALLAASLHQAEAEGAKKARMAANIAIDCAALLGEHSTWHLTLFKAIGKFVDQGPYEGNDLSFSDRDTVAGLANIGCYLADGGYGLADGFRKNAEEAAL